LLVAVLVVAGAYFLDIEIKIKNQEVLHNFIQTLRSASTQEEPAILKLFKSGENEHSVTFNNTLGSNFEDIKSQLAASLYGTPYPSGVTLHTELGDTIATKAELLRTENVYVLRPGDIWIFPGKYVGYKAVVAGHLMETLSMLPRVFKISNYLTEAECDAITTEAAAKEEPSTVYEGSGKSSSSTRTSSTSYVIYTPEFVDHAFNLTKLPKDPGYLYPDHMLQVIHYRENQHFHPHHDAFNTDVTEEPWYMHGKRNRFLTLFIYLSDVEEGGETGFLKYSDLTRFKAEKYDIHTSNPCDTYAVLTVKPKKGDAVLFYDLSVSGYQEGQIEWESLHTGCGVKKGEKWACNVWMYNKPFHDETSDSVLTQWGLLPNKNVGDTVSAASQAIEQATQAA